jgi:DNA-binding helix-hairpin-helix protein with protein kinase domain
LNESNVLVAETALVTIVDTDSFQVWDASKGVVYRCPVGKPEFTPPEMQGKTFGQFNRNVPQDLFGLGIILFQLLMEGTHPFAGQYTGHGEPPPYEQRIAAGHFPYASGSPGPVAPKASAPPFSTLYPSLQHLFVRCFQDGHFRPEARPDTQAWQWALEEAENCLVTCWLNEQHIYSGHLEKCPWCERTKLLGGRDPFPSVEVVKSGQHLAPPPSAQRFPHPHRAPLSGAPHLPPVPRRIPPSVSKSGPGGSRPFGGFHAPRNDWAYVGLFFGVLSMIFLIASAFNRPIAFSFSFLTGIIALVTGAHGEIQSHGWYLNGKGQIPARIAIASGAIPVTIHLVRNLWFLAT